jgi:hypothetical protein
MRDAINPNYDEKNYDSLKKMQNSFTSGQDSKDLANYNTAMRHLSLLEQVSRAQENGDLTALNKLKAEWRNATGSPLAATPDAIRGQVAGELIKTVKSGVAGQDEIKELEHHLNTRGSDELLSGVIGGQVGILAGKAKSLQNKWRRGNSLAYSKDPALSERANEFVSTMVDPDNKDMLLHKVYNPETLNPLQDGDVIPYQDGKYKFNAKRGGLEKVQ